jgi:hypothetical protein
MLYREIIAVCSEIHIKHTNALCFEKAEFLIVKSGGSWSNQGVLSAEDGCYFILWTSMAYAAWL